MTAAESRDTRVAGRGVELLEVLRLAELPRKRVLASARPDQEHLHTKTVASALDGFESPRNREGRRRCSSPASTSTSGKAGGSNSTRTCRRRRAKRCPSSTA